MDRSPQLKLKPSRERTLFLLVISSVFAALSSFLIASGSILAGSLCVGLFGIGVLGALVDLLPGSSYLLLTPLGFEVSWLYRKTLVLWVDVQSFFPLKIHKRPMVAWNYVAGYVDSSLSRTISLHAGGVDSALLNTYGMSSEALAALLNEWRMRYGVAP